MKEFATIWKIDFIKIKIDHVYIILIGLRRSIRCVPQVPANPQRIPRFPEKPEPTLDLSNIVPASPLPSHNGFNQAHNGYGGDQGRRLNTAMSGLDKLTITR